MNRRQSDTKQDAVLPAVRMYAHELDSIKTRARLANLSLSDYVRQTLTTPAPIHYHSLPIPSLPVQHPIPTQESRQTPKRKEKGSEGKASRHSSAKRAPKGKRSNKSESFTGLTQ